MLIEDDRFTVLNEPVHDEPVSDETRPLTQAELFGASIDPNEGLFIASCGEFFAGGQLQGERFFGATVAGRTLRQGLVDSGLIRRWYVINETSEPTALDRPAEAVAREHRVPMPMYWRIPADEANVLTHCHLIHAFVSTGLDNPRNLLFRAVTRTQAPNMAFVHSIPDQSAELLHLLAGQTFPFDVLVSPSHCGKQVLEAHFDRLTEALQIRPYAGEVVVIPHGVTRQTLPDRVKARADLGWSQRVLLLLGRFDADYKADLAPVLIALLQIPDARLVIAGANDGSYGHLLQAQCESLGVSDRVEIRPNVTEATKRQLLAGADVFLAVADNVQETHGLALLEAMAAGLPVVATAWNGFRETVVDGQTGVLVPTAWHAPAASIAATGALNLGSGRPLSLQAQHVRFDIAAFVAAIRSVTPEVGARFGAAGQARVLAEFDAGKNAKRAAEVLRDRVKAAQQTNVSWRTHLGADWTRVFGHYATGAPAVTRGTQAPLDEQRFAALDRGLRKRMRQALERMQVLAQGQPEAALVDALCAEFPNVAKEGMARLVASAMKHGWLYL